MGLKIQVETAVNWGRYAELFDFDASLRRFILPEDLEAEIEEAQAAAEEEAASEAEEVTSSDTKED